MLNLFNVDGAEEEGGVPYSGRNMGCVTEREKEGKEGEKCSPVYEKGKRTGEDWLHQKKNCIIGGVTMPPHPAKIL